MTSSSTLVVLLGIFAISICLLGIEAKFVRVEGFGDVENFNQSTTCGKQVLNATSGSISYKRNISFVPNERCVWIVRVENATQYIVNVGELGFPGGSSDHKLSITGLRRDSNSNTFWAPTGTGSQTMLANLLIVAFHSGEKTSNLRGFHLTYEAFTGSSPVSSESRDYFQSYIHGATGALFHPQVETYSNYEISTCIFTAEDNLFNSQRQTELTANTVNLEQSCWDYLQIFSYNPFVLGQNASWTFMDTLCSHNATESWRTRDLQMVVFRSDASNVYRGFGLGYKYI